MKCQVLPHDCSLKRSKNGDLRTKIATKNEEAKLNEIDRDKGTKMEEARRGPKEKYQREMARV